jgi:hypothetical protein
MICPMGRAKYFSLEDWTLKSALIGLTKSNFSRKCGGSKVRIIDAAGVSDSASKNEKS